MTATRHNPAAADLRTITRHWADLHAMLVIPGTADWPPAGRMADHQAQLSDEEQAEIQAEAAAERAERTAVAPGERPIPLRAAVLDTLRTVDADLVALADQVADSIQLPVRRVPKPAGPADEIGRAMRLLATKDEYDPRRWRIAGAAADEQRPHVRPATRTGLGAAHWILARIDGDPGPFRELRPVELARLAVETRVIRGLVERTLKLGRRTDSIPRPCACGGQLVIHHGGELTPEAALRSTWGSVLEPEVECQDCGMRWVGAAMVALVQQDQVA